MRLRDALGRCAAMHADDWIAIPGDRPATAMVAGLFDPGMAEPRTRPLVGHTIAVYEPDARLSLVWPVPEDDDEFERGRDRHLPEWAEEDSHTWKSARLGWVVVLLSGCPIWQEPVWYLDWGSGIGGYVADFRMRFSEDHEDGAPRPEGWGASAWSIELSRLTNVFSHARNEFYAVDPTSRLVPVPSPLDPVAAEREARGY